MVISVPSKFFSYKNELILSNPTHNQIQKVKIGKIKSKENHMKYM